MYVTSANECWALDAGSGREIWHYQRPRTKGLVGNAAGGVNRGVGVSGDRLFMVTDHAHLIALDRHTGALLWETEMADWHQNYNATGAPLPVGNLVVTGTSGGDEGVRGFVAAFDQTTGKEVWRFWTVPRPGEKGSETWQGKGIAHPGGSTWMTGAYDPQLDALYWPVGNPGPDLIGDDRQGDNLYTDSIVCARREDRSSLKWHFQFTPHDVWDYDVEEPTALVDSDVAGAAPQAARAGEPQWILLRARSHERLVPVRHQFREERHLGDRASTLYHCQSGWRGMDPTPEGSVESACRSTADGGNWNYSTSFSPVDESLLRPDQRQVRDLRRGAPARVGSGEGIHGWVVRARRQTSPRNGSASRLRYPDGQNSPGTMPQSGQVSSWGGVLSTAGSVVIFGDDSGALMAADAKTGQAVVEFAAERSCGKRRR